MYILENKYYKLSVGDNGRIQSLTAEKGDLLAEKQSSIFSVQFRNENGEKIAFCDTDAEKRKISVKENKMTMEFLNLGNTGTDVVLSVSGNESANLVWKSSVKSDLQLEWIDFPSVTVPDTFEDNGGDSKLLWPFNEGALITDVTRREKSTFRFREPEYPSLGLYAMCPGMVFAPFMAVTSGKGGLYLGAHDTEHMPRNVDFLRTDNGILLRMRTYPGVFGGNYTTEFDTVLSVFEGDWYNGAEIYRDWFDKNKPLRLLKISENKNLPEWYSQSPIVITYCIRGHHDTDVMEPNKLFPYTNALPLVDEMAKKLNSKIMVLLMHWEGTAPWAPPYVWPPYGGEKALKDFIDGLHKSGNLLGVYCSGFGWTQKSNVSEYSREDQFEKDNLSRVMCLSPEGDLPLSKICRAQRSGYDICPSQKFLTDVLTHEVEQMSALGIDYAQMLDQNHGGTPYMCYSKEHGHPPVPGKWQNDATVALLQAIHKAKGDSKLLIGCESSAAEAFIPELLFSDNRYELNFECGNAVPLYSYLYHEYLNNFMGNQVNGEYIINCRKSRDSLLYRLGYSFAAGDFFTFVINDEGKLQWAWGQKDFSEEYMPDGNSAIDLAANLNPWRTHFAKKYLHNGKMLKPMETTPECYEKLATITGDISIPCVLTACYRAEDDSVAQIFVNWTERMQKCRVKGVIGSTLVTDPAGAESCKLENENFEIKPLSAVLILRNG